MRGDASRRALAHLGVDLKVSSLGRFQGKPAMFWVPDIRMKPILKYGWIRTPSDRFAGLSAEAGTQAAGCLMFGISMAQGQNTWYPECVFEFYLDGTLVREIHVENIKVNPSFSKNLFDIDILNPLSSGCSAASVIKTIKQNR